MESIEIPHKDIIRGRSITGPRRAGPGVFHSWSDVSTTRGGGEGGGGGGGGEGARRVTRCTRLSAHALRRTTTARKDGRRWWSVGGKRAPFEIT